MSFKEISIKELQENVTALIGDEWMLVTAGGKDGYNMMTASWGGLGIMWAKPVTVSVIRPQRYTKKFLDNSEYFTLSFYGDNKEIHKVCGSKSGADIDKTAETGLVPVFSDNSVYFEQARLVLVCKKLYVQPMDENCFVDKTLKSFYEQNDYHIMYVGEITKVLVNND